MAPIRDPTSLMRPAAEVFLRDLQSVTVIASWSAPCLILVCQSSEALNATVRAIAWEWEARALIATRCSPSVLLVSPGLLDHQMWATAS